jgi:hypothetical protein
LVEKQCIELCNLCSCRSKREEKRRNPSLGFRMGKLST